MLFAFLSFTGSFTQKDTILCFADVPSALFVFIGIELCCNEYSVLTRFIIEVVFQLPDTNGCIMFYSCISL